MLHALKRNKVARNLSLFAPLIKTPGTASVVMPANGRIAVSSVAGGSLTVTIGARTMTTPVLAANQVYTLDWIEKGKTVASAGRLYVVDEWNRPFRIAN